MSTRAIVIALAVLLADLAQAAADLAPPIMG